MERGICKILMVELSAELDLRHDRVQRAQVKK